MTMFEDLYPRYQGFVEYTFPFEPVYMPTDIIRILYSSILETIKEENNTFVLVVKTIGENNFGLDKEDIGRLKRLKKSLQPQEVKIEDIYGTEIKID